MKCSHIPCEKEGIYKVMYRIYYGIMGEAWYCEDHIEEGRKLSFNDNKGDLKK